MVIEETHQVVIDADLTASQHSIGNGLPMSAGPQYEQAHGAFNLLMGDLIMPLFGMLENPEV